MGAADAPFDCSTHPVPPVEGEEVPAASGPLIVRVPDIVAPLLAVSSPLVVVALSVVAPATCRVLLSVVAPDTVRSPV